MYYFMDRIQIVDFEIVVGFRSYAHIVASYRLEFSFSAIVLTGLECITQFAFADGQSNENSENTNNTISEVLHHNN